jgi:PAS domain S-box-containing protein
VLGMLAFVLQYTGRRRWLEPGRFAAIAALPAALVLLAWTNRWHGLFWSSVRVEYIGGFLVVIREYGPAFWAELGYCYLLMAVCVVLLGEAVMRSAGLYRAQAAVMLFGALVPWIVSIIDLSDTFGHFYVDLTAATFAVTGLAFVPGLWRFRLLDLAPVAWATVVERVNDAVVVIDSSGRIVACNLAAQRLVARPAREVLTLGAARVFAGWPALAERLRRIDADKDVRFEIDGPQRDPVSSFDARVWRLGDGPRFSGWVLVLRDVTERKEAEEERLRMLREQAARAEAEAETLRERAARAEAEAASRAKDRFLATLSHELHLERGVIDAHDLIQQVVEICREDLRSKGLVLALDLAARGHHVDADPARLQQVLWNLIKNAIKFTPAGGTITIQTRDGEARLVAAASPPLIVEVSDTGIGIEPEALPRIFEVFDQGGVSPPQRLGGLGLGLTISRSIVEQHGGRLTAASGGKGLGATFTVALPTTDALPVRPPLVEPRMPGVPSEPRRALSILLVEDNADTLNYLSKMLAQRGHEIHTADTFRSATRLAAALDFDVLVSDIELPDGSGLELMGALRSTRPVPGIALSGFGSSEDIALSRSAGFAEHLTKPVDFRRLEEAIRQVAADAQAVGPLGHR